MHIATLPAAPRDNLLGVCHAIGTTLGIAPIWLRLALMLLVLLDAKLALLAYAAGGAAVAITEVVARIGRGPARRRAAATASPPGDRESE